MTFAVAPGELVALLGPNGIGKTTLLGAIAGLRRPTSGRIIIDGDALATLSAEQRARRIALVASDADVPLGMTTDDVVLAGRYARRTWWEWNDGEGDRAAADAAMRRVGVVHLRDRLVSELSAGERQRVWIALALAQETGILLLDEPTSHLDVRHAIEVLALLRDLARDGNAVVAVLHDLDDAATIVDRGVLLGEGGIIAQGNPRDVFTPEALERAYGVPFENIEIDGRPRPIPRATPRRRAHGVH